MLSGGCTSSWAWFTTKPRVPARLAAISVGSSFSFVLLWLFGAASLLSASGRSSGSSVAGVVPVSQTSPRWSLLSSGAVAASREAPGQAHGAQRETSTDVVMDERPKKETPHARGLGLIGMDDMGPQQHPIGGGGAGLHMEAAVGRSKSPPHSAMPPPHPQEPSDQGPPAELPIAEEPDAQMAEAGGDKAAKPGKDPKDVEKEVDKLEEEAQQDNFAAAKNADGNVEIADADGKPVEKEGVQDQSTPDGADAAIK
ncbi:hypothetical protein LTR17_020831 [Elasticomyces elasticus]|nr:hypothetical protein LTR17_020831 [Elasticomyces elasticus]